MANNAEEKESDNGIPAVGESIPIGKGTRNDTSPPGDGAGNGIDDRAAEEAPVRIRRRKSVGSRLAEIKSRIDSGEASEEEKQEYTEQTTARKRGRPPGEKPPAIATEAAPRVKGEWRKKYGDSDNGRERVCTTVASYWSGGLCKLAAYIEDNGGEPIIDLNDREKRAEFNSLLVLACDDILPSNFQISAAMIAAGGSTTLLIQGALVARKVKLAKTPQRPAVKTAVERAEEELERAKKANAEVVAEEAVNPTPDKPIVEPKLPKIPKDKEGNRAV